MLRQVGGLILGATCLGIQTLATCKRDDYHDFLGWCQEYGECGEYGPSRVYKLVEPARDWYSCLLQRQQVLAQYEVHSLPDKQMLVCNVVIPQNAKHLDRVWDHIDETTHQHHATLLVVTLDDYISDEQLQEIENRGFVDHDIDDKHWWVDRELHKRMV